MFHVAILVLSQHSFLLWPIIGIAAGLFGLAGAFQDLRRRRVILNTPASKIHNASMGLVEISGLVTGPHVITSPLKQVECYYYHATAWEWRQRGKAGEWLKVADEALHVPFYVDDDTDKLLIDPRGAEVELHCDFHEEYKHSPREAAEVRNSVSEFFARNGLAPNRRTKVEERCIKREDFLFVLGTLSQNPGLDMSITPTWAAKAGESPATSADQGKQSVQEIIHLSTNVAPVPVTEMSQQQKIAAALAKSGIFAVTSWPRKNLSAKAQPPASTGTTTAVAECVPRDGNGFDLHPPVVLMKGSDEPTFHISWRSQRDLVSSPGWEPKLLIWVSPALILACVYFLIVHFR